jgi:uncharacterized membrane protein YccC
MTRSLIVRSAVALLLTAGLCGCADASRAVRKVTYPPDFRYLPKDQVDSAMWQMAEAVRELDSALRDDELAEPAKQRRILELLDRMQATSDRLDAGARNTNHPLLERKVPRLGADIQAARIAASASPPRYALAGAVSGACIYCHFSPLPGALMENPREGAEQPGR